MVSSSGRVSASTSSTAASRSLTFRISARPVVSVGRISSNVRSMSRPTATKRSAAESIRARAWVSSRLVRCSVATRPSEPVSWSLMFANRTLVVSSRSAITSSRRLDRAT